MKELNINNIRITYDIDELTRDLTGIKFRQENFINHHRTSGDGVTPHENSPTEEEFNTLKNNFLNEIINIEDKLVKLIEGELHLTKKGVLAKNRRRPILMADRKFITNVIDEYDHDLQFDRPYLKMERIGDNEAKLVYCVTDELGRNREEKKYKTLPKTASNPDAIIIKLADRIANIQHGGKISMYASEFKQFKSMLYTYTPKSGLPMWDLLEDLLKIEKTVV